jgi:peptidoglycan-associated lipoprotein
MKSTKISVVSYGENKPADPAHDENAWSKNRRSEIVLFN